MFRGTVIPLIWEVQESLGNGGGIWAVPQDICESESVKMGEMAIYMSTEGGSSKRKKGKVWGDRLENKGGGIQWNWIKKS